MSFLVALYVYFLSPLLTLLFYIVFAYVIASWLVAFGVVNTRNANVRAVVGFLGAVVEPMCRPIRRIIPPLNGVLDLSVMIVLLIIVFIQNWALPQLLYMLAGIPGVA